ncbi:MAG: ATP-binding protein [Saccharothrix sp.]|nr:ATP-binding protein [Saccharothrix sp.]
MAGTPPTPERAREVLDLLLHDVGHGHSRALVLRGERGAGKTALLSYLADHAPGGHVVRTTGVETGSGIAFAALHRLCEPLSGHLDRLPAVQRAALSTVLGPAGGPPPRHLLVGLATLGLFARAAADRPLLCVVDDAQWLDGMSAAILAFVARRLDAESVGLVFAVTTSVPAAARPGPLAGLPELRLTNKKSPARREVSGQP